MNKTMYLGRATAIALPLIIAGGMATAGGLAEPVETVAPTPMPAPVPVVSSDWTGFYAGGQLGFGQLDSDDLPDDPDGLTYGVHAGYLYDMGTTIIGAELDVDGTDITDETANVTVDSIARVKLRLGYDAGDVMPYVTAGVARAWTSGDLEADDTGGFAGIGVEYRVSPTMRVSGEVLQHQFEDFDGTGTDIDATTAAIRVSFQF
jgi:opacity protein-like surface antigen